MAPILQFRPCPESVIHASLGMYTDQGTCPTIGRGDGDARDVANPVFWETRHVASAANPFMNPQEMGFHIAIVVLLAGIFFIDVQMGLGFTPWLLYMVPIGVTYWTTYLYAPLVVAGLSTLLVLLGYIVSPPLMPESVALTNRAFGTITFWALGLLIVAYKVLAARLSLLTDRLTVELKERTEDLGRVVHALKAEQEHQNRPEGDRPNTGDEFKREVTNVLAAESRRLQEKVEDLQQGEPPVENGEESLEKTRSELERLGKQLEQLQRDLLRP